MSQVTDHAAQPAASTRLPSRMTVYSTVLWTKKPCNHPQEVVVLRLKVTRRGVIERVYVIQDQLSLRSTSEVRLR